MTVKEALLSVMKYNNIGEPPLKAGGFQVILAEVRVVVAFRLRGLSGAA